MAKHPDAPANPVGGDVGPGYDEGAALPPVAPALREAMAREVARLSKFGLALIALKGKKPIARYAKKPPSLSAVVHGVLHRGATGIGVLLGDRSGGLICRDFDEEGGFARWAAKYAVLATVLPRVRTRRGRHVYARVKGLNGCWKISANSLGGPGELRAGESYVVVPPSLHPSGHQYGWEVELPESVEDVPIVTAEVFGVNCEKANGPGERATREDGEDSEDSEDRKDSNKTSLGLVRRGANPSVPRGRSMTVAEVVDQCRLDAPGMADAMTHQLARGLKFNAGNLPACDAKRCFEQWFTANCGMMSDPDFDIALDKFVRAFATCVVPLGGNLLDEAVSLALTEPDDCRWSSVIRSERSRLVLKTIRALSRLCAGQPAPVSSYSLAALVGAPQQAVSETLGLLERKGLIHCAERGVPGKPGNAASTYVYVPSD